MQTQMDQKVKSYFDNLTPGKVIQLDQAQNPQAFKEAAFDYIDLYGHSIGFIQDYQAITKYHPIPSQPGTKNF